jgi:RNA polymerase sigma-70 factor (ECF subfamily)
VSESDLIASARQGDVAAWEALVGDHQEAVFRLAYLLLADADEAQDVAQDAFVRAFRALGRFDASRPLRPWLLRITANLARNRLRSAGRYWAALQRSFWEHPEPAASVEERSLQRLEAQQLWRAVRRLNLADQQVIYLRYYLELPEAEMATALAVAPGTIKSRLHRALNRLRPIVAREFPLLHEERTT